MGGTRWFTWLMVRCDRSKRSELVTRLCPSILIKTCQLKLLWLPRLGSLIGTSSLCTPTWSPQLGHTMHRSSVLQITLSTSLARGGQRTLLTLVRSCELVISFRPQRKRGLPCAL